MKSFLFFLTALPFSILAQLPHYLDSAFHSTEVRGDTVFIYQTAVFGAPENTTDWEIDSIEVFQNSDTLIIDVYYDYVADGAGTNFPPYTFYAADTLEIPNVPLGLYKLIVHSLESDDDSVYNQATGMYDKIDTALSDSDTSCFEILNHESFSLEKGIEIYPNPAADFVYFNDLDNEKYKVKIYDSSGQFFIKKSISIQNPKISVKEWPKGVYFLEWKNPNGKTSYKRFLKE